MTKHIKNLYAARKTGATMTTDRRVRLKPPHPWAGYVGTVIEEVGTAFGLLRVHLGNGLDTVAALSDIEP